MTRVVLANEMGGGWGHLLPLRSIAEEFIRWGCEVVVMCRDPGKAAAAFGDLAVAVEPSPAWVIQKTGFSLNYAQNLWGNGYRDSAWFGAHFTWWSNRFGTLKPDFILADYAPTALLAGLALGLPRGAYGTGFTLPPMTTPMPSLHPWLEVPAEAFSGPEQALLETITQYVPWVSSVAGIFEGAERFLGVFPEMDHFEFRPSEKYMGPVLGAAPGPQVAWPEGTGCRVYLYLSSNNRCLDPLINLLKRLGLPTVGVVPGLPQAQREAMESATLRLSDSLVNLEQAASQCDLVVTQGGMHTSAAMLLAGARLLICPEQLEQALLAYRLKQRGLCEFVSFFGDASKVEDKFEEVASSAELGTNVAAFAAKYAGYESSVTAEKIVRRCLSAA